MPAKEQIRHLPRNLEARDIRNPKEALLEVCTPTFASSNIMGITSKMVSDNHIHAIFLDAEGTFVRTWGTEPNSQLTEHMRKLKAELNEAGHRLGIGIVTNRKMSNLATFTAAMHWSRELDASIVMSPLFPEWRKPKPFMIEQAASQLGVPVEHVLMVGDKLTGDIAAGNRAGAQTFFVEKVVGNTDLLGDRILRRPVEAQIYKHVKDRAIYIDAPELVEEVRISSYIPETDTDSPEQSISWWNPQWKNTKEGEQLRSLSNVIYGYGIPFDDSNQKTLGSRNLYVHGGEIADVLTKTRVPLTIAAAIARHAGYKKTANGIQIGAELTDFVDGLLAKRSQRGPTEQGAAADRKKDKQAALIRRASLYVGRQLSLADVLGRVAADYRMEAVGKKLIKEKKVEDTSAVWSGRIATATESVADGLIGRIILKHPSLANLISNSATTGKIGRIPLNSHLWQERHRLRTEEEPHLKRVRDKLLAEV